MKAAGAKKQTIFLTAVNALVRALGLMLRVLLSRWLGAEIMGISELAQGVHMLAITPLTSGLPTAVSRMTALAKPNEREKPLAAALWLSRAASTLMIPLLLMLSPLLARLMGDVRVLPSLWFSAPCILILGYSASFNGYCYGMERSRVPAYSELIEQVTRLGFSVLLLYCFPYLTTPWLAALPTAATMVAELLGLIYVLWAVRMPLRGVSADGWRKPVLQLSLPTTLNRLAQTLLKSLTSILIPIRLQLSGLPAAEATARLGMLSGMVMPIVMLPCVFTSALSMVALPRIARAEDNPRELRRLLMLCVGSCLPVAAVCVAGIWLAAPLLSVTVYRVAELTPLFRAAAPLAALCALGHMTGGVLNALGQQKRSMYGSFVVGGVALMLTYALAAKPDLRLDGVIVAQLAAQGLNVLWNVGVLALWRWERRGKKRVAGRDRRKAEDTDM